MSETRTLLIEGWRFIPHSYAVVNQFQCLELLRRPGVRLLHRDLPFYRREWSPINGCLDPHSEALLRAIPAPAPGDRIDATYRIAFPYDFSPSPAPRTCVFATAEFGRVSPGDIVGRRPLAETLAASNNTAITASNWSREGFLRSGAAPDRVVVIPHGIDTPIFHPLSDEQRQIERQKTGWDRFVFLSVGAMTPNKGISLLLKAFAAVASRHPRTMLALKGMDALYPSQLLLKEQARNLSPAELSLIQPRVRYIGGTVPFRQVALLSQMADAYVAPYYGEGFAMPVLEAIACGCPVICTAGGPTDDFTTPDFSLRINSNLESVPSPDGGVDLVTAPNFDNLLEHMLAVIEQPDLRARARLAGPKFAVDNFTWKAAVDRLLAVLFPQ